VPANAELAHRLDAALGAPRGDVSRPPDAAAVARQPQPWAWPGLREIVPATIAASILFVAGQLLHVFPATALEHLRDAYNLDFVDRARPAQPELRLQVRADASTVPAIVDVLQDGVRVFKSAVAVPPPGTSLPLTSADTGHHYQARAVLPGGNLAVSNAVWVPSDTAVIVTIDASPWANVIVRPVQVTGAVEMGAQATPFSVALVPGQYALRLSNNGVTPQMDETINVTPGNRVFHFTMPGFDPLGKAAELTRGR
jgi:hypothetical protein